MSIGFEEIGYKPNTEVKETLTQEAFKDPSREDRIHFFKSESCKIPELQTVIHSTVLISESLDTPGGSGVIISFEGKKFIITATHVIGDLIVDPTKELKYFYRDSNDVVQEGIMSTPNMLYESTTARRRGFQEADTAIFTFDGDNEGVEISNEQVETEGDQIGVVIGFPGYFQEGWKDSSRPLLSIGRTFKVKPKVITPYLRTILDQHIRETGEKEGEDLNIYFTGRIVPGNSGGPLVDSKGKVLGVCYGPRGTLGKEDGTERFVDFRPIFREVVNPS